MIVFFAEILTLRMDRFYQKDLKISPTEWVKKIANLQRSQ